MCLMGNDEHYAFYLDSISNYALLDNLAWKDLWDSNLQMTGRKFVPLNLLVTFPKMKKTFSVSILSPYLFTKHYFFNNMK